MIKILYIFLIALAVTNCSIKKVVKHHGVPFLEKKQKNLIIDKSTSNDIRKILGTPSTRSKFDNDIWIYIEREITRGKLLKFGKNILVKNDILILEIDSRGILVSKKFSNIDNMQKVEFSEDVTISNRQKHDFIYRFLSSLRQKVNDPLGKRKK